VDDDEWGSVWRSCSAGSDAGIYSEKVVLMGECAIGCVVEYDTVQPLKKSMPEQFESRRKESMLMPASFWLSCLYFWLSSRITIIAPATKNRNRRR
jgi:hypothetical protein